MFMVICLIASVLAAIYISKRITSTKNIHLPPSPSTLPIVGNLHQLIHLKAPPHVAFTKLGKALGPVFTIWFGDAPIVVVNDFHLAKDVLFSKKCHGRPQREAGRIVSKGFKGLILADAGCPMQHKRGVFKRVMDKNDQNYEQILQRELNNLIETIAEKTASYHNSTFDISDEITAMSYKIMVKMIFNVELSNKKGMFEKLQQLMKWLMGGLALTNIFQGFPMLRSIPIGRILFLDLYRKEMFSLVSEQYNEHLKNFQESDLKDLTDLLINEQLKQQTTCEEMKMLTRDNIEVILSDFIVASLDTVTNGMKLILFYLSLYKEYAEKCKDEIKKTTASTAKNIGNKTSLNIKELHFLQAFVSETLRYTTVAPLGVPHKAVSDMKVNGYIIPEGTTVFINIDCIHHDEALHRKPKSFKPERFLDGNGKYKHIDGFMPFAMGRRECPGKSLAMKTLVYFAVEILKNFDIESPRNAKVPTEFHYETTVKVESLLIKCKRTNILNNNNDVDVKEEHKKISLNNNNNNNITNTNDIKSNSQGNTENTNNTNNDVVTTSNGIISRDNSNTDNNSGNYHNIYDNSHNSDEQELPVKRNFTASENINMARFQRQS